MGSGWRYESGICIILLCCAKGEVQEDVYVLGVVRERESLARRAKGGEPWVAEIADADAGWCLHCLICNYH
jgi:hypothetical protein